MEETSTHQPIYFGIAIWGRAFCQAFMEYCLLSLLASGNIPALPNIKNQNKFLFCTTVEDWEWLQLHPHFILLSQYISPELVPINLISAEEHQRLNSPLAYKLHIVTRAHTKLVSTMHEAKCIGSLIFPDTIYAKDALKSIYPHILKKDKKAILVHFSRFATPGLLQELKKHNYIKPQMPIEIENRSLIRHALNHKNLELLVQNWESLYAVDFLTETWWPLTKSNGLLCHSFMWCPVFIDYSKLTSHNTQCLENNTIDGAYLYSNFKKEDLYVVTDSDEFVMISYSAHLTIYLKNRLGGKSQFNNIAKIGYWRKTIALLPGFVDSLKIELLKHPVFVHTQDLTRKEYNLRKKSQRIIQKILSEPTKPELFIEKLITSPIGKKLIKESKKLYKEEALVIKLLKEYSTQDFAEFQALRNQTNIS